MNKIYYKIKSISKSAAGKAALYGLLCALAIAISSLESFLPTLPLPGAKLGLANIVTMFALTVLGTGGAFAVTSVKAMAAFTRGAVSGLLSFTGGVLSMLVMTIVFKLAKDKVSYIGIGVSGAVVHNITQLIVAMFILGPGIVYFAPVLLIFATLAGILTGSLLNMLFRFEK